MSKQTCNEEVQLDLKQTHSIINLRKMLTVLLEPEKRPHHPFYITWVL
jgi:hypothetical protein